MRPEHEDNHQVQHPLDSVPDIPEEHVAALKNQWIETAEQALAAAITESGREGLKTLLHVDDEGLKRFLDALAEVTGPEAAARLQQPGQRGGPTGALLTEEQKLKFGVKKDPENPSRG